MRHLLHLLPCLLLWASPAFASLQVMPFAFEAIPTSATSYTMIEGASSWNTTQVNRLVLASPAGRLIFMRIELSAAMTAGATFVVTLQSELTDTALAITFNAGDTIGEVRASVAMVAGNSIGIEGTVTAGTPGAITGKGYLLFTPTTVGQVWLPFSTRNTSASTTVENWMPVLGHTISATESANRNVLPSAATCSALYIELGGSIGAGDTYDFDLVENGGADTAVDCQVTSAAPTCNSGADTNASVAGDFLGIEVQPESTPTAQDVFGGLTCVFTDTDDFLVSFSHTSALSTTLTQFIPVNGSDGPSTTEAQAQLLSPIHIKALYVVLGTAPGAGTSRTATLRLEGANAGTAVTISETATAGNVAYARPVQYDDAANTELTLSGAVAASTITVSYLATVGGGNWNGATIQGAVLQ